MKKLFFLLSITLLLFVYLPSQAFADDSSVPTKVNYDLPYPGLLPDSPFYFLHAFRDKAISFLISDPAKKAEFDLLQADKRLSAGQALGKEGKYKLAVDTISKGENYFEQALTEVKDAKKAGGSISETANNLYLSSQKHQEILQGLIAGANGSLKKDFELEQKRAQDYEKIAKDILSHK